MEQHTLILWAKPRKMSFDEMTDIAYPIMSLLKEYGEELNPRYQKVWKKSEAREFDFSRDSIRVLFEKEIDKEALRLFNQVISGIGFFSSFDDNTSTDFSLYLGNSNQRMKNTCLVSLPECFSGLTVRREEFILLFKQLITVFRPTYAFVSNRKNVHVSIGYSKDDIPTFIHWLNYFDTTTAKAIGKDKLFLLEGIEQFANGYFYRMQDEPLSLNDVRQVECQRYLGSLLGLQGYLLQDTME